MTPLHARKLRALILVFVVTLPAVTARLYSSDEVQYYSYLRSLWFDRDVSFDNEYRYFYDHGVARTPGFAETFLAPLTPTGRRESFATMGAAVLWAPFYALADVATRIAPSESRPPDGYSRFYVMAVAYGSAFYGFAAVLLSIAAARRMTSDGVAAGVAVWLGTPLLFYMYAAPPFAHACSAFAVALFVTIWLRVRATWEPAGVAALGLSAALMAMVREQDILYALGPALDFALTAMTQRRERAAPRPWSRAMAAGAAGVGAFALGYLPQLLAYRALNGRFGPSTLVTRKMTWTAPHAAGVLASPEHGWLAWTPLALLAIVGLVALCWQRAVAQGDDRRVGSSDPTSPGPDTRRLAACMLLMLALQVYVSGSVESWTVAGAFGQRRFVGATILLAVGVAALWRLAASRPARLGLAAALVLCVWWNVGLMALFGAGLMDRQRLDLRQNAYDVFVTLPREAPGLVYRYFAHRDSFYKS